MTRRQRTVAVTGATGFLGQHLVSALAARGWNLRLLVRRDPVNPGWQGFTPEVVIGSLADGAALRRLVVGADAVIHLAGLIKAYDNDAFMRVNETGSRLLAGCVAEVAGDAHFIHVSSLAARSPELSGYAASKCAGEQAVLEMLGPSRVSVIRPPAIYGPGDRETLIFFKLAKLARIPLPSRPNARFALIHVEDAAAILAALAERSSPTGRTQSITDLRPAGYSWREILETAAAAVGNTRPRFLPLPISLIRGAGAVGGRIARLTRQSGMINAGKVNELLHEDWAVTSSELYTNPESAPKYPLDKGFLITARWYEAARWL